MHRPVPNVFGAGIVAALARRRPWIWRSEEGQDLLEYGLLMALIAVLAIGAVSALGNTINTVFWQTIANNF
jgi:Flp pilus assembly pilin Flp